MSVNRGSEWTRWDLHVHTPLSFEAHFKTNEKDRRQYEPINELDSVEKPQRYDGVTWAKYIEHLENIEHVDCLGVTDYFSLEGYELIKKLRDSGRLDNFDLILPNIEFRLDTITSDGKRINLHVVFSDEIAVDKIRREFLHNLKVWVDRGDKRSLCSETLRKLGKTAKENYNDRLSNYNAGCKYARVKFDDIMRELNSTSLFSGNYLIILSGAEWSEIDWGGQDAEKRRQLLADSHALFSNNTNDLAWATGRGDISPDRFREKFGSLKPVFSSSDSHRFSDLCKPDDDKYCWIKANHTFSGLKQVVYEPQGRLDISDSSPESYTQIQTLRSISIDNGYVNSSLSIDETEIPFNSNLISIIGSQGSGKTALLDMIANCFQDRRGTAVNNDNSFIARIEGSNSQLETKLTFEDIESFQKTALDDPPAFVEGADISYIPQGKIVEYCEQGNRLHDQIHDIVTSSASKKSLDYIKEWKSESERISEMEKELRRLNASLHDINPPEVKENLREKKNQLREARTLLKDKKSEIDEFKQDHGNKLKETRTEEFQDKLDNLGDKSGKLDELEKLVNSAEDNLSSIETFNKQVSKIKNQFEDIDIDTNIPKLETEEHYDALNKLDKEIDSIRSEISKEKRNIKNKLSNSTEAEEELSDLREEERQAQEKIKDLENSISDLEEELNKVENIRDKRSKKFTEYVSAHLRRRALYGKVIDRFTENDSGILSDVSFEPKIEVSDSLADDFADLIDMRKRNKEDIVAEVQRLRNIVQNDEPDDVQSAVDEYLQGMEEFRQDTLSEVEGIKFDGTLYDSCLSLSEDVLYQDTPMEQLSRGQKGTVLLKIYLSEGDNPLIIDTPEDNLDNRFVYDELIDAIREAKSNRQIFIATHDANLVVNTDSDQVIISSFDEGKIKYKAGALEDSDIRSDAKKILEGGDEAFRRREEKYELQPT